MKALNYGLADWFISARSRDIQLAKSFAPAEIPAAFFPPSSYPVPINFGRQQELDASDYLAPHSLRVVF